MEENVALDSNKQKIFLKSIKGIKKLIKKNDPEKQTSAGKVKEGRVHKKKRKERGLVYLSHIPHGFYEHQMTQYFKQFGMVTNARVIRSKKTGNSKGFAFVEFKEPAVAQIVADTMNNYLMGKRLLKAAYIPPEKQRFARRKHWSSTNNPGNDLRIKMKKAHNADKDEQGELKRVKKILSNLNRTKKKLQEFGIDYDFFTPVDVPETLLNNVQENNKTDKQPKQSVKEMTAMKKAKKGKVESVQVKETNKAKSAEKPIVVTKQSAKLDKSAKTKLETVPKQSAKLDKSTKVKQEASVKTKKENPQKALENSKQIKAQKKLMLKKGISPLEEFIKIKQDSESGDESDGSAFDSDEFEKMMQGEDEFDSDEDDESAEDSEQSDGDDSSDEEVIPPPKKVKSQPKRMQKGPQLKPMVQKSLDSLQKKQTFEKPITKKPRNKQFKKKK